ncbi:unnamed protein product [Adineta steineri]|nr:unnamed protein product [Adineta steineri]
MPPVPKPRASHLISSEESVNEKPKSPIPPLSQSRARRLKQKAVLPYDETPESPSPSINVTQEDEDEEKQQQSNIINNRFIAKIRENDTLARFKRQSSSPTHANQNDGNNDISRANVSARQRRRDQRFHSTTSPIEEDSTPPKPPPVYDRSISNDSQIDAVEQERKAEKDINDFLHQLDATLRQPVSSSVSSTLTEIPSMFDRTMMATNKLEERRDALRDYCLKEISSQQLKQVLDILDHVDNVEFKQRMIQILGEDIYEKYCPQIQILKFYEDSLFTRQ